MCVCEGGCNLLLAHVAQGVWDLVLPLDNPGSFHWNRGWFQFIQHVHQTRGISCTVNEWHHNVANPLLSVSYSSPVQHRQWLPSACQRRCLFACTTSRNLTQNASNCTNIHNFWQHLEGQEFNWGRHTMLGSRAENAKFAGLSDRRGYFL